MLMEIACLAGGVPVGYLLRTRKAVVRTTERSLVWLVRVLLFLLGLSLGGNDALMANLGSIGAQGAFISLCCLAGTLAGARLIGPRVSDSFAEAARDMTPTSPDPETDRRGPARACGAASASARREPADHAAAGGKQP